jgi:PIN domain nuclease of toxin-antitoxin system
VLLDTHVWVWTQEQPERIGPRTRRLLLGATHHAIVSPISTLEISRLVAAGDIRLSVPMTDWILQSMADLAAE